MLISEICFKTAIEALEFTVKWQDFFLDFSKNHIDRSSWDNLQNLLTESKFQQLRKSLFNGEEVNWTEKRAVLHYALRNLNKRDIVVNNENVSERIHDVRELFTDFGDQFFQRDPQRLL